MVDCRAMALGRVGFPTSSINMAWRAVISMALADPSTKDRPIRCQIWIRPVNARNARINAWIISMTCMTMTILRLSIRSISTPAGRARIKVGRVAEKAIRPRSNELPVIRYAR